MGTKNNPAPGDCYAKAAPDEPLFVLLARDRYAPALVLMWATMRELHGEDPERVKEARECALAMSSYHNEVLAKGPTVGYSHVLLAGILEMTRAANFAVRNTPIVNEPTGLDTFRLYAATMLLEAAAADVPTT